ncbi:MAG: aldehyde ferredoxin oxidoreductase family protein [Candidatus Bathyarchaeia archaeon]|nr:aldehyde ferredoxin oxidoreductase family protein [Candidatus Bathyarchaeota archaeon]
MVGGYAGKILRINLSNKKFHIEDLDLSLAKSLLGCLGIASKIMLEEVDPAVEPFSPENKLIFLTGVLTGSTAPAACKSIVVSRSPLTNIWGESVFSANTGIELKRAGYDMLIIDGASDKPVYLWIHDDSIEIRDASGFWGMDTYTTCEAIKNDLGEKKAAVVCIGPAGENLVRISSIISDNGRAAGRCGLGAVMGSKNLKAIAALGSKNIEVANPGLLNDLRKEIISITRERLKALSDYGTARGVVAFEEMGNLPIKNWTKGRFQGAEKISGMRMAETILVGKKACFACHIACGRYIRVSEGPYAPLEGYGPEYETIAALGSLCMNDNLESIAKANDLCNRFGLDTISTGATIAFAMECYERGIITKDDTGGIELNWGNLDAIIKVIELIGRREGIGAILGEGSKRAAEKIGEAAERYAMHVKGLEIPMHSPYRFKEMGLQYAVSERGACHLRGLSMLPARGILFPDIGFDRQVDGFSIEGKAHLVKVMQDICRVVDALGLCKFVYLFGGVPLRRLPQLYTAVTGWETSLDDLMRAGERIWILQRIFNVRMGVRRKDDMLPKRFLEEPLNEGAAKGQIVELEPMLNEFYVERGLDDEGRPKMEKVLELGLNFAAKYIA